MKSKEDALSVKLGDWEEMIKTEEWEECLHLNEESVNG